MKLSFNRLEDILFAQGCISKEQHAQIRSHIMQNKISSTVAITELKIMDLNGIYRAVAQAMGVEYVPIADHYGDLNENVISLVSENICRAFCVLPWEVNGNELKLLIENPQNLTAIKEVQDFTVNTHPNMDILLIGLDMDIGSLRCSGSLQQHIDKLDDRTCSVCK